MTSSLSRVSILVLVVELFMHPFTAASGVEHGSVTVPRQSVVWHGVSGRQTLSDLRQEYNNIFIYGNRNAASHRWATFILDRAAFMTAAKVEELFSGFCAVSGSPVNPGHHNRYRLSLPRVNGGGRQVGDMFYCCWPCVCDTQDFIRIDNKTVHTVEGPRTFSFVVIGNPCDNAARLRDPFETFGRIERLVDVAREVRCMDNGELEGAIMSDNGYPIIGMFFPPDVDYANDESIFEEMCAMRAANNYNSGMGEIFRKVAEISPIQCTAGTPLGQISAL